MIMHRDDMATTFNDAFQAIQNSVPYNTPNRDSVLCGKYAMYIGALEGLLKIYTPASDRADIANALKVTINQVVKI